MHLAQLFSNEGLRDRSYVAIYVHLRNIPHITNPRTPRNLRRIVLIPPQLEINILRHLREGVGTVLGPEKVFVVEVVGFFEESAVFGGLGKLRG